MARVSLADLRARVLQRADIKAATATSWVTDSELDQLINTAIARLHSILVVAYEDYFVAEPKTVALTPGKERYDLVTDLGLVDLAGNPTLYKLRDLFITTGAGTTLSRQRLRQLNLNELGRSTGVQYGANYGGYAGTQRYRIMGNFLLLTPIPPATAGFNLELWYVPQPTKLVAPSDFLDYSIVFGWEDYIINDAVINIRLKEESDVSALMARQQEFERHVMTTAASRNVGEAERVTDVALEGEFDYSRYGF